MMDTVFIDQLKIDAIVGIFDWERAVPQEIIATIEMANDISVAAASQDIADALDYSAVARRVTEFVVASEFYLLETMAQEVAALIMREFDVPWLSLRLAKTQAMPNTASVGVAIERGQRPSG